MHSLARDPIYLVTLMVIGSVWMVVGGFVGGKIARRDPWRLPFQAARGVNVA